MTPPHHAVAVDVNVTGRVQGVAFRAYAEREAHALGVTGWMRNEPDGSVAGHFEGDPSAVEAMVEWCREGPRLARVQRVVTRPGPVTGTRSFEVRY